MTDPPPEASARLGLGEVHLQELRDCVHGRAQVCLHVLVLPGNKVVTKAESEANIAQTLPGSVLQLHVKQPIKERCAALENPRRLKRPRAARTVR